MLAPLPLRSDNLARVIIQKDEAINCRVFTIDVLSTEPICYIENVTRLTDL